MFNIDETPIFSQTVNVTAPGGAEQDFKARFEALDIEAYGAFDLADAGQCRAFLDRVMVGVEDIVDKDGHPVADSADLRARLIGKSWVRQGLVRAYHEGHRASVVGN